ncbi:hypothetical protein O0I10_004622 [Lichtheimia ornata]|uniref:Uncharacterized protein n=1 Tax=Lichtheimia ornata TaxID=688661 RepID=A0AAD7V5B2_9FUNG|nr:uncharacterized protein O0I10_004622 [Lichtheimia ornata]KAJ8659643.1 hypothetical protein O0I10_004622 [Lichtheimia ornata]
MRPEGFKNASAVRTASIQVRLLISLPTERRWISLMMPISGSNESMSAGDDCVIQRDHCRELLVFWCFDVNHVSHGEAFMSFGGVNLYCVSGGWLPSNGRFLWRMSANERLL